MLSGIAKSIFRVAGMELRRFTPAQSSTAQLAAILAHHGVNLVFDVGANVGQFARELRSLARYKGRIVSFEPMEKAHNDLLSAARGDARWDVAERAAIGAQAGTATLNIAGNSVSSSLLPMLESHLAAAKESVYRDSETVPMSTLDSAAGPYVRDDSVIFLKVDTQGYEAAVLAGATTILERASIVQLEMSLVPLYDGQVLMDALTVYMRDRGFVLWGLSPSFVDPRSGQLLQLDGIFCRGSGE